MKNLERNTIIKKILVAILILTMIIPYFPMSVFAEDEGNNQQPITFTAKWSSNNETEQGTTNDTFGIDFSMSFNNINGFQNVGLVIKTDGGTDAFDTVTVQGITGATVDENSTHLGSGQAILDLGNINSGTSIGGTASVSFKNLDAIKDRKVTVTLTGTYRDNNGDTHTIEREIAEKVLNARITPAAVITPFSADLTWQKVMENGVLKDKKSTITANTTKIKERINPDDTYEKEVGFYTNDITVQYPLTISSYEKTQKLELNITINRYVYDDNNDVVGKLSEGYTPDWGALATDFCTPTETTNADGSKTYTFIKGTDSNTYDSENVFTLEKDYVVSIKYDTPNTNPKTSSNADFKTYTDFKADLTAKGFKLTKQFGGQETSEAITETRTITTVNNINLYSYTPGDHAWVSIYAGGSNIYSGDNASQKIDQSIRTSLKSTGTARITGYVKMDYIDGVRSTETGSIKFNQPTLKYLDGNGVLQTVTLTSSQMAINSVVENGYGYNVTKQPISETNGFRIDFEDLLSNTSDRNLSVTYTLSGLTDEQIDNIQGIYVNYVATGSSWISGRDSISIERKTDVSENLYSYMELSLGENFDVTSERLNKKENRTLTLKMYKNEDVLANTATDRNYVVNVNPIFYVVLPAGFTYKYDMESSNPDSLDIDWDNVDDGVTQNGETYLRIPCIGTYDSRVSRGIDITIPLTMKLTNANSRKCDIKAYMITDNENYFTEVSNSNRFNKVSGEIPEKLFLSSASFNVTGLKRNLAETKIEREIEGSIFSVIPNPADEVRDWAEKEQPEIVSSNSKVTYVSQITNENETLENVSIIARLPIADNTFIQDSNSKLIEDGYKLDSQFYSEYGSKVNGFTNGDTISQLDMVNLNIIGVFKKKGASPVEEECLDKVKIYVSSDANANFNSTSFQEYIPGTTSLTGVKNIKVVLNSTEILEPGQNLLLKYEMTMPNQKGMVGAQTAVQCTKSEETNAQLLYSAAAYVINGQDKGTIKVQKTFENYAKGVVPTEYGVSSLAGIQFKLQYFDEAENGRVFLKDSNNQDVVATTDANGVVTFTDVPAGKYYLYEVTEFEYYAGIGNVNVVDLQPSETENITVENRLKRGKIVINKTWENVENNEHERKATFNITRNKRENETYQDVETSVITIDNKAYAINLPYGDYTIDEYSTEDGWAPEVASKNITLKEEVHSDSDTTFKNQLINNGVLKITKTVPDGESVNGLKFHITGSGVDKHPEDLNVNINADITFTIGESSTYPSNVSVNVYGTTAIITVEDLYLGYYTIEEIEIPTIGETEVEKYIPVKSFARITKENVSEPVSVTLTNSYKYGTIQINKTAKLRDGETLTDIADLSQFKVHVTGTSDYGHTVDEYISLNEEGFGRQRFEIGTYTLTEVPVDGYTTYYGTNSSASTDAPTNVRVDYNKTYTQDLYNEHTGVGFVRVEKSLEGITDPQKVVDAGIKFKVIGRNVAGQKIGPEGKGVEIEINEIDTEKNVAYGISPAISTGGEYELQEIPETVPEYYEAIEPREIEIKSTNTSVKPLVVTAVDERIKGNLEIVTTTNPAGGPLKGIKYTVTPVKINSDGTYQAIGDTQEVEGSNEDYNPSFAKLENINAGYYVVDQKEDSIPTGWEKDVKQIVEVPGYNTGYANFEITEKSRLRNNKVIINKELLKPSDSGFVQATSEDITKAKLNENEQFEIKIRNINTSQVYYVFTSVANPGVIQGLETGTYAIEEVFKPKYLLEGYYATTVVTPNVDVPELQTVTRKIDETEGKGYLFEVKDVNGVATDVTITVKNVINTSFGFGGQDNKNNLSKTEVDVQNIPIITKAVVYVVDENNEAVSGVKFKLVNSRGETVVINELGTVYEIPDKKLVVRGLEPGVYTLKCVEYPQDKYLKPDDKQIVVYNDASLVGRVEVQRNIPRGSLTLSTTYINKAGEQDYTSKSKYKIVNSATGELLKFVRTATGDYKKSNLEDASPVIVLKAGPVEVEGIETGDYEVGIVDVTKGFGITKTEPEYITLAQNEEKAVNVRVIKKTVKSIGAGANATWYLNENGDLYVIGNFTDYVNGSTDSKFKKISFPVDDVKIEKFEVNDYDYYYPSIGCAIDKNGDAWIITNNAVPECITNQGMFAGERQNNVKFVDIQYVSMSESQVIVLLDNKGRVWTYDTTNRSTKILYSQEENPAVKLAEIKYSSNTQNKIGFIDSKGKVWIDGSWVGYKFLGEEYYSDNYSLVCISDVTDIRDEIIEDFVIANDSIMVKDSNGYLWICGNRNDILTMQGFGTDSYNYNKFRRVSSAYFGGAKVDKIMSNCDNSGNYRSIATVIDEYGRVWIWGYGNNGSLGNGATENNSTPICISDGETEKLYGTQITDIDFSYNGNYSAFRTVALDSEGRIWTWGGKSEYGESGSANRDYIKEPKILDVTYDAHLEYNLKFSKVFISDQDKGYFAIDEDGKLWSWGENSYGRLGYGRSTNNRVDVPTIVDIPGSPKMKKVASIYGTSLFLSEDGRVYICGSYYTDGNGNTCDNKDGIIEITDNFNLPADVTITDVHILSNSSSPTFYAIDSNGKVYTWAYSSYAYYLGRTDNENYAYIECISDDITEILHGKNVIKIATKNSNQAIALTSDGSIYNFTTNGEPELLSDGNNFVDVFADTLLDNQGRIWKLNDTTLTCISNTEGNVLNDNLEKDSSYKITNLYPTDNNYYGIIKDSNGNYYSIDYSSYEKYTVPYDGVKDIAGTLIIDENGQLWNGDRNMAVASKNDAYGIKFEHIDPSKYYDLGSVYKGKDGNYYSKYDYLINDTDTLKNNNLKSYLKYEKGRETISYAKYNSFEIAVDDNDKLWYWYSYDGTKVCYNDESTELADVHFVKVWCPLNSNTFFASDSNGKLWAWGLNSSDGLVGNNSSDYVSSPVCLSDISGYDISNITSIEKSGKSNALIAKDDNGNVWMWGSGFIGNGSAYTCYKPYHVNTGIGNRMIKDMNISAGLLLCTDGTVYRKNSTSWSYARTAEGATNVDNGVIYGNNKIWIINNSYYPGVEDTTIPTLISSDITIDKFIKYPVLDWDYQTILDTNGNIWYWTNDPNATEAITKLVSDDRFVATCDKNSTVITDKGIIKNTYGDIDISQYVVEMYGELTDANIRKFADLINDINDTNLFKIVDGKVWKATYTSSRGFKTIQNLSDRAGSEMAGKQIVELNDYSDATRALDSEGNLYRISDGKCLTTTEYLTESTVKFRQALANNPDDNKIYGLKFKELYNDRFAKDVNDNMWYFSQSGNAINLSENETGVINPLYVAGGIKRYLNANHYLTNDNKVWMVKDGNVTEVFEIPENIKITYEWYSNGYEFFVGTDENGRLCSCGANTTGFLGNNDTTTNGQLVYLSDVEGTALHDAVEANPNLTFKCYKELNTIVAIDSTGKVWVWGYDDGRVEANKAKIYSPVCVSDLEGSTFKEAYENNILFQDFNGTYYIDQYKKQWRYNTSSKKLEKRYDISSYTVDGLDENTGVEKIFSGSPTHNAYIFASNGNVYIKDATDTVYKKVNGLENVQSFDYLTYSGPTNTDNGKLYTIKYRAIADNKMYILTRTYYTQTQSGTTVYTNDTINIEQVSNGDVNNYIDSFGLFYVFENDGKIYYSGNKSYLPITIPSGTPTIVDHYCLNDVANSPFYNKTIVEFKLLRNCYIAVDSEGNVYKWATSDTTNVHTRKAMTDYSNYEEALTTIYGEANAENMVKLLNDSKQVTKTQDVVTYNGELYSITRDGTKVVATEMDASKQYLNGIGAITDVVGEYEIKTSDGRIYRVNPISTKDYELSRTRTTTPFETAEPDTSVVLDGINVKKQTQHKALDTEGNLYAWDEYTGLIKDTDGVVNVTEEEYSIEPIYVNSTGWTVIRREF